ncbi:MAG: Gldg family protein, partial [Spirochaetales bacterium]
VIPQVDLYEINWMNFQNPQITGFSVEKRVTGTLLYVTSGETPVIYDIVGHREKPLFDLQMKPVIERENFTYKQLNLLQSDIPEDVGLVVINSPKQDITPAERDRILSYLEKGGRLLLMADFQTGTPQNLKEILASYGVELDFGVVVEMNKNYNTGNPFHVIPEFSLHEIVRPLKENNVPVVLQFAQGIKTLNLKRRTVEIEALFNSSKDSFLRVDLQNNSPNLSPTDKPGPITLGVAIKEPLENKEGKETRIVVFGSGTLLEPLGLFGQIQGNFDLFMNALTWLQDRPESIAVRSKSLITLPMYLSGLQVVIFGLLFTVIIPLGLFAAGLGVWLKRRHL